MLAFGRKKNLCLNSFCQLRCSCLQSNYCRVCLYPRRRLRAWLTHLTLLLPWHHVCSTDPPQTGQFPNGCSNVRTTWVIFSKTHKKTKCETKIKRPSEQHMIVIWLRFCGGRQNRPLCSPMAPGVHLWRWTPGTLWNTCQDPFSRKDFCGVVRSNWANQPFASCVASTFDGGRQGRAITPRRTTGVAASLWPSLKLSTRLPLEPE